MFGRFGRIPAGIARRSSPFKGVLLSRPNRGYGVAHFPAHLLPRPRMRYMESGAGHPWPRLGPEKGAVWNIDGLYMIPRDRGLSGDVPGDHVLNPNRI